MDKQLLLKKLKEGNPDKKKIIAWVENLPETVGRIKPTFPIRGDVYMHPIFKHPYVLLKHVGGQWKCGLLTTESKCNEILEPAQSRLFKDNYFTKTLFTQEDIQGGYISNYEHHAHLTQVYRKLKKIFK